MKKNCKWYQTGKARHALYGFLFGCCFPILALTIDFIRLDLAFTIQNIQLIHQNFPIHYIIESAPFVLSLMAFNCGRSFDKISDKNLEILEVSKFKDNFLASMSHEIRTPMSGIIGIVDILNKGNNLNEKEKEYVDIIKTSSNDLMKILNDILDLSKLEAGKLEIHPTKTNVRETCAKIHNIYKAVCKSKNISIKIEVSDEVPEYLMLDAIRVRQVLSNLIGNAIKFSDEGIVRIRVTIDRFGLTTPKIRFEVIDQGIGIKENELQTLFAAYKQVFEDRKEHINGTGLGLLISKQLVELMKGTIEVHSEYGRGSNFWFKLDVVKALKEESLEGKLPSSEKRSAENLDMHILIAEDNPVLCKIYDKMLRGFGCQAVIVKDGSNLIDIFREDVFDIILMDINMPKMGGVECMKYLKTNYKNVPPIIGASASALKGDIDRYMSLGFDDYITKPFTMGELNHKLWEWNHVLQNKTSSNKTIDFLDTTKQDSI